MSQCIVKGDGYKIYYKDKDNVRKRHREDGPAVIFEAGDSHWYANDILFSDSIMFCEELGMNKEEIMVFVLRNGHTLVQTND